jgi:hypothetical protein
MLICGMRLGSDLAANDHGRVQRERVTIRATVVDYARLGIRTTFAACSPATIAMSRSSHALSACAFRSSMSECT